MSTGSSCRPAGSRASTLSESKASSDGLQAPQLCAASTLCVPMPCRGRSPTPHAWLAARHQARWSTAVGWCARVSECRAHACQSAVGWCARLSECRGMVRTRVRVPTFSLVRVRRVQIIVRMHSCESICAHSEGRGTSRYCNIARPVAGILEMCGANVPWTMTVFRPECLQKKVISNRRHGSTRSLYRCVRSSCM